MENCRQQQIRFDQSKLFIPKWHTELVFRSQGLAVKYPLLPKEQKLKHSVNVLTSYHSRTRTTSWEHLTSEDVLSRWTDYAYKRSLKKQNINTCGFQAADSEPIILKYIVACAIHTTLKTILKFLHTLSFFSLFFQAELTNDIIYFDNRIVKIGPSC